MDPHSISSARSAVSQPPYISVVVTSRNDAHGGSPLVRTQVFLDSLADQCQRYGLDVELIFVDWNPPSNQPRLNQALRKPAAPTPLSIRFIEVPADIHQSLANHDKQGLFQMIAKNVGIRRARGEFILATNIDILFSEELFAFMAARTLDRNVFYVAERHDLGVSIVPQGLLGEELMAFARDNIIRINYQLETCGIDEPPPKSKDGYLHSNACGDFTLMSREGWERIQGYPELQLYSLHIDTLGLFSARASGLKQHELVAPFNTFHIEHGEGWSTADQELLKYKPALAYLCDCQFYFYWSTKNNTAPRWNDADWGYDGQTFPESGFSTERTEPEPGPVDRAVNRYAHWIELLKFATPLAVVSGYNAHDLARLEFLASNHKPEAVFALGSDALAISALLSGTDCRLLHAGKNPDKFPDACEILGITTERLDTLELSPVPADLQPRIQGRRVLLHIDAMQLTANDIERLVNTILPNLDDGALVFFDNLWHSPQLLSPEIAQNVFRDRMLPRLDPSLSYDYEFNAYHEGGSLIGFPGAQRLAQFINDNRWRLCLGSRHNGVWYQVDRSARKTLWSRIYHPFFDSGTGHYSPFAAVMAAAARNIPSYRMPEVLDALTRAGLDRSVVECARAAVLAASGRRAEALVRLEDNAKNANDAACLRLRASLRERLVPSRGSNRRRRPGLTIFSTAKPFTGQTGVIQTNAIESWTKLSPSPEIILFGDEAKTAELARKVGARHVSHLRRDEFGIPLINGLFEEAQKRSETSMLAYVNADIMLVDGFPQAAQRLEQAFPLSLGVGRRWEIPNPGSIDFSAPDWCSRLRIAVGEHGFYEGWFSADYFLFSHGTWDMIPPFAIGRMYWDNWLIIDARERGIPVVDTSECILAIHQNHDYSHIAGGRKQAWHGIPTIRNRALLGRNHVDSTMAVANWQLTADALAQIEQPRRPDGAENKRLRFNWLMAQSRRLLDQGMVSEAMGIMEELQHRTFIDRAAIEERLEEYRSLLEMKHDEG